MTIKELLAWGDEYASKQNKESSAIKLLIQHYVDKEGYEIIRDFMDEVDKNIEEKFKCAVIKYCDDNIPVQHIMGYEYFLGHKFFVNEDVLIPRFETEELVHKILENYDMYFENKNVDVVDVGTGSGAIAIALALEEKNMKIVATELSESALVVARKNAEELKADVNFYQGDMLQPLITNNLKFDILVSNPPYIPSDEVVDSFVKDNEPHLALFGGKSGVYFYDVILKDAHKILNDTNIIAFEHGYNQAKEITDLALKYFPNAKVTTFKDLNKKDRITIVVNK